MFFFFKQKTAYELRISDWSSDVCSSDLARQASVEDLDRVYGSIYATGSQFQVLQTMTPIFDEPVHLSDQGVLTLTGHYRTRSEEHTSELQSLMRISYAVFCLKKNIHNEIPNTKPHNSISHTMHKQIYIQS